MNNMARTIVNSGSTFLTGLLVGVGTGLMLAPYSGARTRRRLRALVEDAGERTGEVLTDASEAFRLMIKRGKRLVA